MFKATKTFTRPSLSVPFFWDTGVVTDEYKQYVKETYRDTGMLISSSREDSADGLSCTMTLVWRSRDDLLEYLVDAYNYETHTLPMQEYCDANGILSSTIGEEI